MSPALERIGRLAAAMLLAPFVVAALYLGFLAVLALRSGYSWREMDWDDDGTTTLAEFFETVDIARRPAPRDGQICTELYRLKDGLPVRVECATASR
jgi:hypothetical protein